MCDRCYLEKPVAAVVRSELIEDQVCRDCALAAWELAISSPRSGPDKLEVSWLN